MGLGLKLNLGLGAGGGVRAALQYLFNGFPATLATGSGSALVADYAGVLRKATSPTAAIEGGRLATTVADGAELGAEILSLAVRQFDSGWIVEGESTVSGGVGRVYSSTGALSQIYVNSVFTVGRRYVVSYTVLAKSGAALANSGSTVIWPTVVGENSIEFVANETGLFFKRTGITDTTLDNISVREVIPVWYDTLPDGVTPLQPSVTVRTRNGSVKRYIDYPTIQRNQAYALNFKAVAVASDGIQRWYTCSTAGTSAASAPTFGVSGTTADGTAVWTYGGYATLNHKRVMGEPAVTSYALHNRNLTNAVWAKSNCTAAKDQTGVGAVANAASSLTASANAGTCLQSITLASGARTFAPYVKRITGTGTVEITLNGGTDWTDITAGLTTSAWYRGAVTATLANPQVGFRLGTSGDKIAVDYAGLQGLGFATSPSETTTTTASRPPTVNSIASAGRIGAQNYAVWGEVRPSAAGQPLTVLFDTFVDTDNRAGVATDASGTVGMVKRVAASSNLATTAYISAANVPFQYLAAWTDKGMCIATRVLNGADWSSWSTWATNANTDPAPIAATFEIGSRNGANQFAGNYPWLATKALTPRATLAEYQADLLDAKGWSYIGVSE